DRPPRPRAKPGRRPPPPAAGRAARAPWRIAPDEERADPARSPLLVPVPLPGAATPDEPSTPGPGQLVPGAPPLATISSTAPAGRTAPAPSAALASPAPPVVPTVPAPPAVPAAWDGSRVAVEPVLVPVTPPAARPAVAVDTPMSASAAPTAAAWLSEEQGAPTPNVEEAADDTAGAGAAGVPGTADVGDTANVDSPVDVDSPAGVGDTMDVSDAADVTGAADVGDTTRVGDLIEPLAVSVTRVTAAPPIAPPAAAEPGFISLARPAPLAPPTRNGNQPVATAQPATSVEPTVSAPPAAGVPLLVPVAARAAVAARPAAPVEPTPPPVTPRAPRPADGPFTGPDGDGPAGLVLGAVAGTRAPARVPLTALRQPTVVFAGSGAGKTALVRRLVEGCALRGVSSVVLDATGELARLGDAWPAPPVGWAGGDAELAREYLEATDVVVWTPGRDDGRPLSAEGDVDPAELLTPVPGRRARVSVVSLLGLAADEERQRFVGRLQLALAAWARSAPATGRGLAGLFVQDEAQAFAPAGAATPSARATLALAAEAGEHGLGLVLAAQSPRGLREEVLARAATWFFGRLNAPAQIDAARELAAALGGEAPEIGRLGVGEFYATSEGLPFQRVTTPMCLSHHAPWPLAADEIIARARAREAR
ncbi:ATP-binding protein, partial [Frankia nepalensis]|uniref:ATP-binding protein n=1 Tax=Frankia nepalensis TaxID=1836974 RepID=UPI001D8AE0B3|nr:hypothetical protein [Frankia nepalensis]